MPPSKTTNSSDLDDDGWKLPSGELNLTQSMAAQLALRGSANSGIQGGTSNNQEERKGEEDVDANEDAVAVAKEDVLEAKANGAGGNIKKDITEDQVPKREDLEAKASCREATTELGGVGVPAALPLSDMSVSASTNTSAASTNPSIPGAYAMAPNSAPSRRQDRELSATSEEDEEDPASTVVSIDEESQMTSMMTSSTGSHHVVTEAIQVEEDRAQLEAQIRESIFQEAVQARVLPEADQTKVMPEAEQTKKTPLFSSKGKIAAGLLAPLALVALAIGLGLGLSRSPSTNPEEEDAKDTPASTLQLVQERGVVTCGIADSSTLNQAQCRAMALLALGDPNLYQTIVAPPTSRFQMLQNRTVDILTQGATHTMGRDVYEGTAGFTFTQPYLYSGLIFGGIPQFVKCAEALEDYEGECREMQICVANGSTHFEILMEVLRGSHLVFSSNYQGMIDDFLEGKCNVIASEPMFNVHVKNMYEGDYILGTRIFSKEPLALVTRQDDPEWSTLASLVVSAFIIAEAHNITQDNAHEIADLVIDENASNGSRDLALRLEALVSEFGHHGDLYHAHIEEKIPRGNGLNTVYQPGEDSSGLLYAIPFGKITQAGPGPVANGTLEAILHRGHLQCGVFPSRGPGFDHRWSGLDVDYCRGLAASLFDADTTRVEFVPLLSYNESYGALTSGVVDVVAGARVTLQAMYQELTTEQPFHFSVPYFYDNDSMDAFALMTQEKDPQWNDLVYWVVMATIYAEEEGITSTNSTSMPVVDLFGQDRKQMFRDLISSVGNYADLYNRSLQKIIPRSGANRLNEGLAGPQLYPIPLN